MRADAVKVAIIAGQLDQGGSERQLYLWLAGLDRDEFDPVVLNLHPGATAHWHDRIAELDVRVVDVPRQLNRGMRSLRVAHAVRKLRPQLVHSWHIHTNWYAAVAARASGARSLGSCRGSPASIRSAGPIAAAFPALNGMVANSAEAVEALRHADFFGRPVFHVRNGLVDWEHDRVGARRQARELGLDTDAVLVAVLGRVVGEKGLDDLVGVAARVLDAAAHPVQFVVIGEGRDRQRLEEDSAKSRTGSRGEVRRSCGRRGATARRLRCPVASVRRRGSPERPARGGGGFAPRRDMGPAVRARGAFDRLRRLRARAVTSRVSPERSFVWQTSPSFGCSSEGQPASTSSRSSASLGWSTR